MEEYVDYLKSKGRFTSWLVVIFLLLLSIPILIQIELTLVARIIGLLLIIISSVALFYWLRRVSGSKVIRNRVALNANDRFWLNENIPFYRRLAKQDRVIFEDRVSLFLAEIIVTDVSEEVPSKSDCFFVASSAIIAYWGLPYWNYGELDEVLLYPDNFDENKLVSSKGHILGSVHQGGLMDGTMILSRRALIEGFRNSNDGRNVGIHEFTHLLDKADGHIDGLPVGLTPEQRKIWLSIFHKELNKPKFHLDSYARTNEAEFFAVSMEMYKEKPEILIKWHPELYAILKEYFGKQLN